MITTTIFPGRYVQGAGAIDILEEELSRFGERAFVVIDDFVDKNVLGENFFSSFINVRYKRQGKQTDLWWRVFRRRDRETFRSC